MGWISCPECQKTFQNKQSKCPNCGWRPGGESAPESKKASANKSQLAGVGCLILIAVFVFYFIFSDSCNIETPTSRDEQITPTVTDANKASSRDRVEIKPKWDTSVSRDEMTGEKSCYAFSEAAGPTEKMDFPYHDVEARLGVGTDGRSEWAYILFNEAPNLPNKNIQDGYNLITARIKWDDTLENNIFTQEWGGKALHFDRHDHIISMIAKSNTLLVELNWYNSGQVYFRFSLNGSSAAIANIRKNCGGK